MPSAKFHELINKCKEIHDKKSADYASEANPFSNFERAAQISSWFQSDNDKVFAILVGVKLARLAELLSGKEPKNESIEDSFLDLSNYCLLWGASFLERKNESKVNLYSDDKQPGFICYRCKREFHGRVPISYKDKKFCSDMCVALNDT